MSTLRGMITVVQKRLTGRPNTHITDINAQQRLINGEQSALHTRSTTSTIGWPDGGTTLNTLGYTKGNNGERPSVYPIFLSFY